VVSVAVDVGGTFTDFVVLKEDSTMTSFKLLSTLVRPELAIIEGLTKIGEPIEDILHATTIATNAIMGQYGLDLPKVALFVTKGFKDIIEIARQNRPNLYDVFFEKPRELVPRNLRIEVDERVDYSGKVTKAVNESDVEHLASQLRGIKVAAISFLHSYANPANEKATKRVLGRYFEYVCASNEIAPEPREYERTSTAVLNALLMPIIARYLHSLERRLTKFSSPSLCVMASSGGLVDLEEASSRPVQLIESGPAAGLIAASEFAAMLNLPNVITFDMGGTTAKAGTVLEYEQEITAEYEVGGQTHHGRIQKGSGYPVRFPFLELSEVSAGGGTIIWKDNAGALHVGPLSSGAEPGPVSYGRGGTQPTLTDANLVLGRLSARLLGGGMRLNVEKAKESFAKLGNVTEVASSAIRLANLEMARAIRLVTVERGLDPSNFALVAFGGAGPQHAAEVAEELGVTRVIIPPEPATFSALGMLLANSKFEIRCSFPKDVEREFQDLESKLGMKLKRYGTAVSFTRFADVRYEDQGWEVTVPIHKRPIINEDIAKLFEERHQSLYGFTLNKRVEIVTIRVFATASTRRKFPKIGVSTKKEAKTIGQSRTFFEDKWLKIPIYDRESLGAGFRAKGPLRIDEYGSCTLVPPSWKVNSAEFGALLMEFC
jgi:N-methylhydantoinase A